MLNDIFEKILELEKEILEEETNLPTKKEHIVSEYRTKAQQEIAVLMRDNEHQHDEKKNTFCYFGHYSSAPPLSPVSSPSDVRRVKRQMIASRISAIMDPPCQL